MLEPTVCVRISRYQIRSDGERGRVLRHLHSLLCLLPFLLLDLADLALVTGKLWVSQSRRSRQRRSGRIPFMPW